MAGKISQCYHDSKALLPLKAVIFCFYGAVCSLTPFLSSHMQALGLSLQQTISIYAVVLLVAFVFPPAAGYMTDIIGRFRLMLILLLLLTGVFHTSLLSLPSEHEESRPVVGNLLCTDSGTFLFERTCSYPEPHCLVGEEGEWTNMTIFRCHRHCQTLSNNPNVTDPPPQDLKICFPGSRGEICEPLHEFSFHSPTNFSVVSIPTMYESRSECIHRVHSMKWFDQDRLYPRCPSDLRCSFNCSVLFTSTNGTKLQCDKRPSIPAFPAYFVIRLLCAATLVPAVALIEAAIVTASVHREVQYGKQKVWAYVAAAIFTPVAGKLVDQSQLHKDPSAFYPLIIQFDVLILVCIGIVTFAGLSQQPSKKRPKVQPKPFGQVLQRFEGILLLGAVFFLGAFWGVLSTFLFGFLEDLRGTSFMLGISKMVASLVCIPIIYFSDFIMNRIGRVNVLSAALLFYGLQLLSYSYISLPWWSAIIELLDLVSGCLKVAAMVTLAHKVAPIGRAATIQGTIHCLHYNVGAGLGILISGALADTWDLRISFRILGTCSLVIAVAYSACYHLMKRKQPYEPSANGKTSDKDDVSYMPETGV